MTNLWTHEPQLLLGCFAGVFSVRAWLIFLGHVCQTVEYFSRVSSRSALLAPYRGAQMECFTLHVAVDEVSVLVHLAKCVLVNRAEWSSPGL